MSHLHDISIWLSSSLTCCNYDDKFVGSMCRDGKTGRNKGKLSGHVFHCNFYFVALLVFLVKWFKFPNFWSKPRNLQPQGTRVTPIENSSNCPWKLMSFLIEGFSLDGYCLDTGSQEVFSKYYIPGSQKFLSFFHQNFCLNLLRCRPRIVCAWKPGNYFRASRRGSGE